jgi:5-methylcytosine-specific restriction protein A
VANADYSRLYNTAHWKRLRRLQLITHPLCTYCERQGVITAATVADHIDPHKGDLALFYDADNLQSLCDSCHSRIKQIEERHGVQIGSDLSGAPLDLSHHWNKN